MVLGATDGIIRSSMWGTKIFIYEEKKDLDLLFYRRHCAAVIVEEIEVNDTESCKMGTKREDLASL